eukprot:scaffold286915_cov30-Tisochrysis_lutea.AAC.3
MCVRLVAKCPCLHDANGHWEPAIFYSDGHLAMLAGSQPQRPISSRWSWRAESSGYEEMALGC